MMNAQENLYIVFPGSVTGDLWHVAAAQILSSHYPNAGFPYRLVALIAITQLDDNKKSTKDEEARNSEWDNAAVIFNYLRNISLDCLLVKCLGSPGKNNLETNIATQGPELLDEALEKQTDNKFEALVNDAEIFEKKAVKLTDRKLRLMNATTIAMNILQAQGTEARDLLAQRLHTPTSASTETTSLKSAEYLKLDKLIKGALGAINPRTSEKFAGVVLENYRIGHVNAQTNSNYNLSNQLIKYAADKGFAVISVAAVKDKFEWEKLVWDRQHLRANNFPVIENCVFDLYGKEDELPWPGIDPRAQAYFWSLVAKDSRVFGLYGGRSGSLDIAAFSGVYSFFWDEPWIQFAAGIENTGLKINAKNRSTCIGQVPQCLRSLELSAVAYIGLPKADTSEIPGKKWSAIEEIYLSSWFNKNNDNRYPYFPGTKRWSYPVSLNELCRLPC